MSTNTNTTIVTAPTQFSQKQGEALAAMEKWIDEALGWKREWDDFTEGSPPQVFRVFGFAGSGKTTLAAFLAHKLRASGKRIRAATFTGKAALIMRKKGFSCSTIHSLIYKPAIVQVIDNETGQPTGEEILSFILNDESELLATDLLIVDEVSMVGEDLARDLLSFGVPILVLGDPGQLPPISGTGFFTKAKPNVMLTEIHRQALDSPIIRMSMDIRTGVGVRPGDYGGSRVIRKALWDKAQRQNDLVSADQVLCGLNKTRHFLNREIRQYKGYANEGSILYPLSGEKIICLKNDRENGLFNGGLWTPVEPGQLDGENIEMRLQSLDEPDSRRHPKVKVHLDFFQGLTELPPKLSNRKFQFDFGHAITTHKAQGSQWDNILVVNENYCFRDSAVQWLYTAVTRAAERLTLVV